jgi:hypothetical protein
MKITVTNTDISAAYDVLASTLRLISEQPSDWVIRVTYRVRDEERVVEGTISLFDQHTLLMADMDQECQHTGGLTEVDLYDITEIEVL